MNQVYEMDDFVKQLLISWRNTARMLSSSSTGSSSRHRQRIEENLKDGRNTYQTDYVI